MKLEKNGIVYIGGNPATYHSHTQTQTQIKIEKIEIKKFNL